MYKRNLGYSTQNAFFSPAGHSIFLFKKSWERKFFVPKIQTGERLFGFGLNWRGRRGAGKERAALTHGHRVGRRVGSINHLKNKVRIPLLPVSLLLLPLTIRTFLNFLCKPEQSFILDGFRRREWLKKVKMPSSSL